MDRHGRHSETKRLQQVVDQLPGSVADWTLEQRQQYSTQSDRAMREQNGTTEDA
ncbi:hypothetical protein ABZ864_40440 [Streptomyces sp. NPDC047082]|uniref:hypothetical protein n=1 Tax=Streptomyces sp. NPDC047082 TaxID=3155259 RepID=UPI0033DD9B9A